MALASLGMGAGGGAGLVGGVSCIEEQKITIIIVTIIVQVTITYYYTVEHRALNFNL